MNGTSEQAADGSELASQACASCRKQKRKCDKKLPACGLCQRIGRMCDYMAETQLAAPSPEDFAALRQQVADLQNLITSNNSSITTSISNGSSSYTNGNGLPSQGNTPVWPNPSSFPSLFFLDSNAFGYGRFQIQSPYIKVPPGALQALGSSDDLRQMVEYYFATVHSYLPIVSKIRLYQHLANPLHEPGADIALLFLSMKLACSEVPEGSPPQTQLYQDVKSFYQYMESQNGFSVRTVQVLLLIALYEIGNAIYPAAYLTVGNAARLGYACGLHDPKAPQMLPRCTTWTEQEERRRLWWGVVILDRFVSMGHRGTPLATMDPAVDTYLPSDDDAWDRGEMLVAAPLFLSASKTIRVSPYARTCQAAHLLGKMVQHLNDMQLLSDFRFTEALQLHRTMRALADVLPDDASEGSDNDLAVRPALCTSMAITYSSLMTLYDAYMCTASLPVDGGEEQLLMQKESIDGLRLICDRSAQLSRKVREIIESDGMHRLSPMVVDVVYQAAANYAWYLRETSDPTCGERLIELKALLGQLDRRWKAAGECLRIVEAWEFEIAP